MIKKLRIKGKYYLPLPDMEWAVPDFAVVTGKNGSGKTRLLTVLYECCSLPNNKRNCINAEKTDGVHSLATYLISENAAPASSGQVSTEEVTQYLGRLQTGGDSSISKSKTYDNFILYEGLKANDLRSLIAVAFNAYMGLKKSTILDAYDGTGKTLSNGEIDDEIGRAPWDVINDILIEYGFDYIFLEPQMTADGSVKVRKTSTNKEILYNSLSYGERTIIGLVLLCHNPVVEKKAQVLLLDEFDAHLNPSLSKAFIGIVKNKIVGEYGIQVIMTTHSPSTVAYVEDEDLFWLDCGEPIRQRDRCDVIPLLSDGVMTFSQGSGLLECAADSDKDVIIFTEGKTDCNHLRVAAQKLTVGIEFDVFSCGGDANLKQFITGCPRNLFPNKTIIGLFDADRAGVKACGNFGAPHLKHSDVRVCKEGRGVFAVVLPVPSKELSRFEQCSIEFLYPKEILDTSLGLEKLDLSMVNSINRKGTQMSDVEYARKEELCYHKISRGADKVKFSADVSKLPKEAFANFTALFDLISSIVGEDVNES